MAQGLIAAFDVGTTAAKGVLVDRDRGIVCEQACGYDVLHRPGGHVEQEPDDWWEAVRRLARTFWQAGWDPREVEAIALTGQMQDVILVDGENRAVGPAILYSDARAAAQAVSICATLRGQGVPDDETVFVDGTAPVAKLAWLRERDPTAVAACARVLFNAKDYVLARLTGVCAADATTAATTGLYSMEARGWRTEWCDTLGIPARWLPPLLPPDAVAGPVSDAGARATGFAAGTPVYGGMGDAAAATLSAGLTAPGQAYMYLGTTGWAASLDRAVDTSAEGKGVRHLPYVTAGDVIRIAPVLNAGGVHRWIARLLDAGEGAGDEGAPVDYARFERLLEGESGRSGGALFLPYLDGERCPVQESRAMGAFVRLGSGTGRGALGWAVLEGIAFSLRQVLETLGASTPAITVLGGMARSPLVRQLVADVCGVHVRARAMPGSAGALAAAVPAAVARGWFAGIPGATAAWFGPAPADMPEAAPAPSRVAHYEALYRVYEQIYPLVSQIG